MSTPEFSDPAAGPSRSDSRGARLYRWLDERLSLGTLRAMADHKTVPMHRWSVLYYLGGMTLFFFCVQVATGILLMLYYRPSADEAFESVELIMTVVPFGWLVRSIHSWAANLMVFFAFLHLATVFFLKAYRPPRELTWVSGVVLLFLAMGFGFSGYLLPWNQLAFFATKVGTDIAGSIPLIGETMVRFLRGGDQVTGGTLSRFYGWHVAILPAITTLLLVLHLVLVQRLGLSVPPGRAEEAARRRPMKFFPHFALRDTFGWVLALGVLATLAALFPWELGEKADLFAPAYPNIAPEWYFMFMFQTLKLVPGGEIFGVETEAIPILLFGLAGLVLLLVPFLDRGLGRRGRSPGFTAAGVVGLVFVVGMTAWGYHSWAPVYVLLLTAVLLGILALGTRRRPGSALVVALLVLGAAGAGSAAAQEPTPAPVSSCVACHGDPDLGGDPALVAAFENDVHLEVGLGCADCHGGDPDPGLAEDLVTAMDPDSETHPFVGAPTRAEIPGFCGRCHSDPTFMRRFHPDARVDQEQEYWTSHHGLALAAGDTRVATCIDCHGVHGILRPADPAAPVHPTHVAETCGTCHDDPQRMAGSTLPDGQPLPVNQHALWRGSVHAAALERGDLSAPTCNDCHGNHGATPPGVASVGFVCGQCHGREADLFRASPKQLGFETHNELMADLDGAGCAECHDEPQASVEGLHQFAECTVCHRNHRILRPTVGMLAPLPHVPCALCHEASENAAPTEPEAVHRHYLEERDRLLREGEQQDFGGVGRFDWLVDRALELPAHSLPGQQQGAEQTSGTGEQPALRPEFLRLFEKFRIGKQIATSSDAAGPPDGPPLPGPRRCIHCHPQDSEGAKLADALVERMWEVMSTTAHAERTALAARRGGVEVRQPLGELDQAVNAQIELEVLVHGFRVDEESPFMDKHAEALTHARAALEGAHLALDELFYRRRGLWVSLGLIALVLVGLALKIRQMS